MRIRVPILVGFVLVSSVCPARAGQRSAPDGEATADFSRRVQAYAELRSRLETGGAKLDETAQPEELVQAEQALAEKIREARTGAKRGDVFAPAVERRFRALTNPELRGTAGRNNRGIIWDEGPGPGAFTLKVNGTYPENQPLSTVPAAILESLPRLPDGIEYRFVGRHLILRDARANVIIDFIPNVIPR